VSNLNLSANLSDRITQLSVLFDISQILNSSLPLDDIIDRVLKKLGEGLSINRAILTLLNRNTQEIIIDASYNLTPEEEKRGRYRLGEGIVGEVIQTGRSIVVPKIGQEPRFLNRTNARRKKEDLEMSFLCVPIKQGLETIGALAVDKLYNNPEQREGDLQVLTVTASIIAQNVSLRQQFQEEKEHLLHENIRLNQALTEKFRFDNIIGTNHSIRQVFELVAQVSTSNATVLIRGESGTGKELIAHIIHYNSLRKDGPFIRVNCSALPESIIESELFGHEKGAFTGAIAERKGRFELAHGGTLFLDEIGDLSPLVQVKLLRALQEREIERVGSSKPISIDVRVIAATNRDLEHAMAENKFREDLFYRLNVFPIHIPPLRERKSDIPLLVDHFIEKYNQRHSKQVKRISTSAINLLMSYHWPGNIRELENTIERAVLIASEGVIMAHHLPPTLQSAQSSKTEIYTNLQERLDQIEKEMILDALKSTNGNYSKAAKLLGITERMMGLRIQKYGLDKESLKGTIL
jgi:Nif-specific regulatory protein